ncbi:hypothetical protein [Paenibacillus agricola]|uniref:Uncharacterized protein n=1 Tax=Paenibacillus agricola TaxID=2716264 RepID=A0ABX0JG55_9BACL|nr:hypothetical protein [Paenibacillus agricola]NHN35540.1 hypothetical protein [Paenibacillus agricola]
MNFIKKGFNLLKQRTMMVAAFAFAVVGMSVGFSGEGHAAPVAFTGVTLPFTVPDMLTTATNFVTLYGDWIMLAIAVIFTPVLLGLAFMLVRAARKGTKV